MLGDAGPPPTLVALWRSVPFGRPFALEGPLGEAEVAWAIEAGMAPLLHAATQDVPGHVPEALASRLQAAERWARVQNADMLEAAAEIVDRCRERSVPLTLLKGLSTGGQYYRYPHQRFLGDLDLLVEREDVPAVSAALAELGYQPDSADGLDYSAHHHLAPVRHPRTGICVELHTGLFPPGQGLDRRGPFDVATLRKERRPATLDGRPVLRLSPELQVPYIASHWALDFVPAAGARALLDMTLLLRAESDRLDWARILGWLANRRLAAHLQLMLSYLEACELLEIPPVVRAGWARQAPLDPSALRVLCGMVERYQVQGQMRGVRSLDTSAGRDSPSEFGTLRSRLRTLREAVITRNFRGLLPILDDLVWHRLLRARPSAADRVLLRWCRAFPPGDPDRFRIDHWLQSLTRRSRLRRGSAAALPDGKGW